MAGRLRNLAGLLSGIHSPTKEKPGIAMRLGGVPDVQGVNSRPP